MRRTRRGFTLVELLVVISIIALLIAILTPSLSKARNQAKSAVCLSNLKRIGLQGAIYVTENGLFPPVRLKKVPGGDGKLEDYYHRIPGHEFRRKAPRWQWFISDELGPIVDPREFASEDAFNGSMEIGNKYWEDPGMRNDAFKKNIRNGAYGYNGTYLGNTRDKDGRIVRFPVAEIVVRSPAETVFVADSRGGNAPHGNHSYWLDPPKMAKYGDPMGEEQAFSPNASKGGDEILGHSPVEGRHNKRGNVGFCDGHAESMRLTRLGYHVDGSGEVVPVGQIDRTKASNRMWTGKGRDDPEGEFGNNLAR